MEMHLHQLHHYYLCMHSMLYTTCVEGHTQQWWEEQGCTEYITTITHPEYSNMGIAYYINYTMLYILLYNTMQVLTALLFLIVITYSPPPTFHHHRQSIHLHTPSFLYQPTLTPFTSMYTLTSTHMHMHICTWLHPQLLIVQPLFDIHWWTGAVVHLVHHIGLGLTDTHNLSYRHNLRRVREGGRGEWVGGE